MAETGGPSTQSGIYYQNTWAALYLGCLIDPLSRSANETVVSVQLEAPESVDDIVVTYRSGFKRYIQAKESLKLGTKAWNKLWEDFENQHLKNNQNYEMILAVGSNKSLLNNIRDLCARAKNKATYSEWRDSLTQDHRKLVEKITPLFKNENPDFTFHLLKKIEVQIWPLEALERDLSGIYLPASSGESDTLLSVLRDMAGGFARTRGTFFQYRVLDDLSKKHKIKISDREDWGIDAYRKAIRAFTEQLSVPGTNIMGRIAELFVWLPLTKRDANNKHRDFEEEDVRWRFIQPRSSIDLYDFPRRDIKKAIIDASAGFGKSVLLRAICNKLSEDQVFVPVIVPLDQLGASRLGVAEFLDQKINKQFGVCVDWQRLCEGGRLVLLFDGLDELSDMDRTTTTQNISLFQSRFPRVSWILTVRDGSILSSPMSAERLDIARLDEKAIAKFVASYKKAGSKVDEKELKGHLYKNTDFGRLLRIPLFLSLVLSISKAGSDLPKTRIELLESYLVLLFSPERHKSIALEAEILDDIRVVAEFLAFQGLEQGGIGLTEQNAKRFIAGQNFQDRPSAYIERLVQFGILNRQSYRLRFTFPIIQEYLASCWITRECPEIIEKRFRNIVQRPWAQTIQFSLEKYSESEQIIEDQLQKSDDAFYTVLRLIGRCVVNGMPINNELRSKVGDKLADAWESSGYRLPEKIGDLISDGFLNKIPEKVEKNLRRGRMLSHGGAEILTSLNNVDITKDALSSLLECDLEHHCWLHGWQDAVDSIAEDALTMYVQRSREEFTDLAEVASISNLVNQLSKERIPFTLLEKIQKDTSLHVFIRLAAYPLEQKNLSRTLLNEIHPYIKYDGVHSGTWESFRAVRFFWRIDGAKEKFYELVVDNTVEDDVINHLVFELTESGFEKGDISKILRYAYADLKTDREIRIGIVAGICGDREALEKIIKAVPDMGRELLNNFIWLAGHLDYASSIAVLDQLKLRRPTLGEDPVSFSNLLISGISYKFEMRFHLSGVLDEPIDHPAYDEYLSFAEELLNIEGLQFDQEIMALGMKKDIGSYAVNQQRVLELLDISYSVYLEDRKKEDCLNSEYPVKICLDLLTAESFYQHREKIRAIVLGSGFNLCRTAIGLVCKMGDENDLIWMIEAYNNAGSELKQNIFDHIEELGARHGKYVGIQDEFMSLGDW